MKWKSLALERANRKGKRPRIESMNEVRISD